MENYFATMLEDNRHECLLMWLLSLTDPNTIKQSKIMDQEVNLIENFASEKLHRPRTFKEYAALQLLE